MLQAGTDAPDFSVKDHNGNTVSLKDCKGKKVVLWFYPKADTPGCTMAPADYPGVAGTRARTVQHNLRSLS